MALSSQSVETCAICAPARPSLSTASWNAVTGPDSASSKGSPSSTIRRRPCTLAPSRSGARWSAMIAKIWAQSSTLRAIGPAMSNLRAKGTTPFSGSAPCVGLNPTSPFHAAGTRTDPPVSVPTAAAASPSATDTAAPDDEPPGARSGSSALGGVAVRGFSPSPENASSVMWVLPRQTMPRRAARARMLASLRGTRPSSRRDPASVTVPPLSMLSFQLMATPSSRLWRRSCLARSWAATASDRARAAVRRA